METRHCIEVAVRGADGQWLYRVDHPTGGS
jgi:hypothetical protein